MIKLLAVGSGRMGSIIRDIVDQSDELSLAGIVGAEGKELLRTAAFDADVVVDFSHRDMLPAVADYVRATGAALVSGTTGYGDEDLALLRSLAEFAPVLHSANYSIGVAALRRLAAQAASLLEGFDIEIVETHHNKKADAPSGTAKMLLAAVDPDGRAQVVHGREGLIGARKTSEIGMHAVRGGSVAGTHVLHFFGEDEEIELSHRATSRRIFAEGALACARRLAGMPPGFYGFDEVLFDNGKESHER